jgi:hypothetical protein
MCLLLFCIVDLLGGYFKDDNELRQPKYSKVHTTAIKK